MSDVIDLNERRNAKEQPDAECVRKDQFGRPLYLFALAYQMVDGEYSTESGPIRSEDAEARVTAMRESLIVRGQLYGFIPA